MNETTWSADIEEQIEVLHCEDSAQRKKGREALIAIGRPGVPALIRALEDAHGDVRWEAAHALREVADPRAAESLAHALRDERADIRWIAAAGLIALEWDGLGPLLRELLLFSDDVWMKEGAHHVLSVLATTRPVFAEVVTSVIRAIEDIASDVTVPVAALNALEAMRAHR